jgi:hypothetical protein
LTDREKLEKLQKEFEADLLIMVDKADAVVKMRTDQGVPFRTHHALKASLWRCYKMLRGFKG